MNMLVSVYHHIMLVFECFFLSMYTTWYFRPSNCVLFDDYDYKLKRRLSRVYTNLDLESMIEQKENQAGQTKNGFLASSPEEDNQAFVDEADAGGIEFSTKPPADKQQHKKEIVLQKAHHKKNKPPIPAITVVDCSD